MINKVWDFIPWPRTRQEQNSLTSYKKDLEREIKKTERKVRTGLTDEQKQERNKQKELTRQARLRQRALRDEYKLLKAETKRLEAQARKQKKENNLRQRLLTRDEKAQLVKRLETEAMSNSQRQDIEKKLKDSKLESTRRKRQLKNQVKYVAPNEKVTDLRSVFEKGVTVKKHDDIANSTVEKFWIIPRNPKMTVDDFMNDAKPEALKLMEKYDERKFSMVLSTKLKRQRLLGNESDYRDLFARTKNITLLPTSDINEIYEDNATVIRIFFYKKQHEGSGWTLEKINHLELKFYKLEK